MATPTATPTPTSALDTPASCSEAIPRSAKRIKIAPSLSDEHHEMVTVILKSNDPDMPEKKYIIHKSIACYHSPVLDKAFNGPYTEGQTQVMTIEDFDRPDAFGAIQSWMYTQNTDGWKDEMGEEHDRKLYFVWILADRLIMPKLQNQVMNLLMDIRIFSLLWLGFIYKNTSPESKLRSFVSDRFATSINLRDKKTWLKAEVPVEFLLDLLFAQAWEVRPIPENMTAEGYHVVED
ncbi:hypothetical protein BKA65DRAFT_189714 [Rhexocercosporidium sp. MPI-PUGE-AT-0058]|nr:hypothetical protein BKA65DRAFT_189714 [Rhexocercosporidium sp. MPI-PUGE-AT-0058]